MRRVLILCLLLVPLGTANAALPPQWLPWESWPGGIQADARLDRPAKLWATAIPLREVFAQLDAQTSVHLGFDPPGDDNARLCLNVYLNPQTPPSLREVMTQLSWVMDCGFAVAGEGETRQYLLLSAGPPVDVDALRAARDQERWRRAQEAGTQYDKELRAAAVPRLLELRAALALPRDEDIRRYKGSDDALLLVLLDPGRRASAQLITAFSENQIRQFAGSGMLDLNESDWTPQQRALAEASTGLPSVEQDEYGKPWVTGGYVRAMGSPYGGEIQLGWRTETKRPPEADRPSVPMAGPMLPAPAVGTSLPLTGELQFAAAALALRRLVGEPITPETEKEVQEEYAARQEEEDAADYRREIARLFTAATEDLSPPMRERLAKLSVPLSLKEPHSLWEVQQAVAAASGMNVISDHFYQPVRPTAERAGFLFPEGLPGASALLLLELACSPYDNEDSMSDWGEAGTFLRFRSRDRATWRAALLPQGFLDMIDRALAPSIPPAKESPQTIHITIETRPYQALAVGPSQRQLAVGRLIADGRPPGDPLRAARDQVLAGLARSQRELTFLAGFDDAQWAKLQGEGLQVAGDLSLDQLDYVRHCIREEDAGHLRELTVRLVPRPDERKPIDVRAPVCEVKQHLFSLRFLLGNDEVFAGDVVRSLEITLDLPAAKQENEAAGVRQHGGR
jgi:hypothetical protein